MDWTWVHTVAIVVLNNLVLWIWKPWTNAYAGEKGKNFARQEDLDKILAEVRAVTTIQKEIEAKISGDTWNRQYMFQARRDIYADLLFELRDLENTTLKLLAETPLQRQRVVMSGFEDSNACLKKLWRLAGLSRVLLSKAANDALDEFFNEGTVSTDVEGFAKTLESIKRTEDQLIQAARSDIGWGSA